MILSSEEALGILVQLCVEYEGSRPGNRQTVGYMPTHLIRRIASYVPPELSEEDTEDVNIPGWVI